MSKLNNQTINVLNYNENEVFVDSSKEHYKFSASRNGETPSIVPMSFNELQYIASNTDVIMTGWLTVDDDRKEEIFTELRMPNWKDILSNKDIEKILTKPTLEGLQKIIDIENLTYFDRVRIIMFKLINDGIDVTTRVSQLVENRYKELQKRQRQSKITLVKKDTTIHPDQVKELSEQNNSLQLQLDEMKKMMEQMMSLQATQKVDDIKQTDKSKHEEKKTTTKSTTKPAAKATDKKKTS